MTIAGLTVKQERFAREYVKSGNGTQAALKAGYSGNCPAEIAHENLRKPHVSEAVQTLRNRLAEKLDISRETLINNAAHMAEQAHASGEYGPAIAATTLIMKAQGYLIERSMNVSVDVTQSHLDALQKYTDARIDAALANHRATVDGDVATSASPMFERIVDDTHFTPSEDRSMGVMEHATHADETKA